MSKRLKNFLKDSNKLFVVFCITIVSIISVGLIASRLYLTGQNRKSDSLQKQLNVLAAQDTSEQKERELARIPVLKEGAEFPIVSARSVMAIDLDSGISLYEKSPDIDSLPASTTKMMTAVVAMEHYDPGLEITIQENGIVGRKIGLQVGETITVDNLLKGLLISSGNDAAEVLARNYEGGRDAFIEQMNEKAAKLKLTSTFFRNPAGLDENGQITTARDLMKLATYAMQKPKFAEIVNTEKLEIQSVDGQFKHQLVNTNELLGKVKGVKGTKTGWTENAQENLVTYIERDGKKVIVVLLGSQDRFGETEVLIEWMFRSYVWEDIEFNAG